MLSSHQQNTPLLRALPLLLVLALLGACSTINTSIPAQVENKDKAAVDHLLVLMDQRLAVAPEVAKSKWNSGAAIDDPAREKQILDDIGQRAAQQGVDRALALAFFQSQFDAGKIVQNDLHAHWRQQQLAPFSQVPDLAHDIRPVLDKLTPELITSLKSVQSHLCDANVQNLLAADSVTLLRSDWNQATREQALAPLHCH
ncbi:gamma subclass chorismate mutase AroQ [Undibacterium sp.]|uniref:gamma subclass chorismate mutase AroQ n=1 Tax=Undibacterium sp. TaxID=1914977 RepID=UPI00374D44A5